VRVIFFVSFMFVLGFPEGQSGKRRVVSRPVDPTMKKVASRDGTLSARRGYARDLDTRDDFWSGRTGTYSWEQKRPAAVVGRAVETEVGISRLEAEAHAGGVRPPFVPPRRGSWNVASR
jgi:hypothetical protein